MKFKDIIKRYRECNNYSQEEMAHRCNLNSKYYGRLERGESIPTLKTIEKICSGLEIQPIELFIMEANSKDSRLSINPKIASLIANSVLKDVTVHINKNSIVDGCESSIWYNGYIGSISFDEFEMLLYATGRIRASLYINYVEVLKLNDEDVFNDLCKYIHNDIELKELIEYMSFDEDILNDKNGNALFVEESNWLFVTLKNNEKGEILYDNILDTDNIFEGLKNEELLFDIIFKQ